MTSKNADDQMHADDDPGRPLHGLSVLDMSRFQPGAYLTRLLAELGADVIKVEQPGAGSPERAVEFTAASLHHSKRSLALDVRHPDARGVLDRLVAVADVVVESAPPGSLDAKGIGYEHFSQINPRLIWCAVTGFGSEGPGAQRTGHDINFLAQSGFLGKLHGPDALPDQPDVLVAGPVAGMMGAVGVLAAVARRDRTGQGGFVDNSIADAAMWFMGEDITRAARGMPPWDLRSPARSTYRCADGRRVSIAATEPRSWAALCGGLSLDLGDIPGGHPDTADETRAAIASSFATNPAAYWVEHLGAASVTACNDPGDLPDDPHVQSRDGIIDVEFNGTVDKIVRLPLRFSGVAPDADLPQPAPAVGADTESVLAKAGFEPAAVAALLADGVVAT